jgi:hypothetical protein
MTPRFLDHIIWEYQKGIKVTSNRKRPKIDIKDRETFANDIRDMLMSLIDEDDINDD